MSSSTFDSQQSAPLGDKRSYPPTSEQSHAQVWNQVWVPKANPRHPEPEAPCLSSNLPVQQYSKQVWQQYEGGGTSCPHRDRSENLNVGQPAHQPAQDLGACPPPSVSYQNVSTPISPLPSAHELPYPPVPVQPSPQEYRVRDHQRNMSGCVPPTAYSSGRSDSRGYHGRGSKRSSNRKSRYAETGPPEGAEHYHTTSGGDYTAGYHYSGPSREMHVIYEQ